MKSGKIRIDVCVSTTKSLPVRFPHLEKPPRRAVLFYNSYRRRAPNAPSFPHSHMPFLHTASVYDGNQVYKSVI